MLLLTEQQSLHAKGCLGGSLVRCGPVWHRCLELSAAADYLQTLRLTRSHHAVEGHPYLRLLRLYLDDFLPRDASPKAATPAQGGRPCPYPQPPPEQRASAWIVSGYKGFRV